MKKVIIAIAVLGMVTPALAKKKKKDTGNKAATTAVASAPKTDSAAANNNKKGPKPYEKVITDKAVTKKGLFTVHKVDDRWFFELPDSLMNREIMMTTRYSKTAGGGGIYAGEMENAQTIIFEKGQNKNVLLRVVMLISQADSTNDIYKAVKNSNLNPIAESFEIKAYSKDTTGVVIDVTDFFKGDNQPVSLGAFTKKRFNLGGQSSDKSYIVGIKTYPINTEIRVVRTFNSTPSFMPPSPGGFPSTTLPSAYATGTVTMEMNNSFILLPKVPMARRMFDSRVGFFADDYTTFDDNQQKVDNDVFICRWRLEPKPEDVEKMKRGELVEPQKPIVYYIDPATPKKWRPYLIQGINDWQVAFERAGFKNAIMGKEWDESDTTMNLDDARFSVLRYLPSDIMNAYGPNVHDPRSGEIIESHIGWYHNIMKLLHDWYMIQTAAVDPGARKMELDDELMGQLIRFVSSHEVGHTLGLRHNMGSSSTTPVEKLRDKAWVEANGHTPSIMDYARFNYVAQPEDNIGRAGLFPRIGVYDKWAIQWGYKPTFTTTAKEDEKVVNKWIIDSLKANPRLWFGTETNPTDPRSQTEDLSDNSMKASEYGIKNLKRIIAGLPEWTKEEGNKYSNLRDMYMALLGQYARYMGHVTKNIGGIYETPKSIEQTGEVVYEPTPVAKQKAALKFLNEQLFKTPTWLLPANIMNNISNPGNGESISTVQANVINNLLSASRLNRMVNATERYGKAKTYPVADMMNDLQKMVWQELYSGAATTEIRRGLQKAYVDALITLISTASLPPSQTQGVNYKLSDAVSVAKGQLKSLRTQMLSASSGDKMTKYHYEDLAARIKTALEPQG